jgi:hypothetical protein
MYVARFIQKVPAGLQAKNIERCLNFMVEKFSESLTTKLKFYGEFFLNI